MKWKSRAADRGFRNSTHFRVLAAVLCAALSMAVSVLLALDQHQPDSFRLLFLLPAVSSVFLFLFLLTAPEEYLRNIGVLLMLAELYIRCTITPLFMETIGTALVLLLGIPFVRWIKPTYAISASVLFFVSVCQFLLKLVNCYTTYISTTNRLIYSGSFVVTSLAW